MIVNYIKIYLFTPKLSNFIKYIVYPNHLLVTPAGNSLQLERRTIPDAYEMWTQQFWGDVNTQTAILVDTYFVENSTFARNEPLYRDKIWNLMGRVVRVATVTYVPYSMTEFVVSSI